MNENGYIVKTLRSEGGGREGEEERKGSPLPLKHEQRANKAIPKNMRIKHIVHVLHSSEGRRER